MYLNFDLCTKSITDRYIDVNLKDRHQNIGKGEIGTKPFTELVSHPAILNAPLILETPGAEAEHGSEVALLKNWRDKCVK